MTIDRTKELIQLSIENWDKVSPNKIKEIDKILDELLKDGLDYENICYFLLNILYN